MVFQLLHHSLSYKLVAALVRMASVGRVKLVLKIKILKQIEARYPLILANVNYRAYVISENVAVIILLGGIVP